MKPEAISFNITPLDKDKTARLEIIIEHHEPGKAQKIGEAVIELLTQDDYEIGD